VLGYDALGIGTGPVFRVGGRGSKAVRARVRDLNGPFHGYLERVKATHSSRWPRIISEKVDVRARCSTVQFSEVESRGLLYIVNN
jgi:hypothetical protein